MRCKSSRTAGVLFTGFTFTLLAFTLNCNGGGDSASPPAPQAGYAPTLVPLGNFNVSCDKQQGNQQQQQVQTQFQQQQQQGKSCTPQFQFTESRLSDWDMDLDCTRREVFIQSKGTDQQKTTLPIQSDGSVKGQMQFQQQVQNDGKSNAVCWVEYVVSFDGKASCDGSSGGRKSVSMDTQVQFTQSEASQVPGYSPSEYSNQLAGTAASLPVRISIPLGAMNLGTRAYGSNPRHIPAGTEVIWTNDDNTDHTVTADDGSFDSGPLAPGDEFRHTFADRGSNDYHCAIHPSMSGSIIVDEAPASPSPTASRGLPTTLPLPTLTATPFPSATPSPSVSPSHSPSPSPSPSASPSHLPSPSPSPSASPSHSPSPSPSPSASPSTLPSASPTPSVSPSPSASPSVSPRPSPRPTPTPTVTITPIQVCVVQQPCPVIGKVEASCPQPTTSP